jgi:hypothetical protein
MKPQASTKYRKHRASKYEFPTTSTPNNGTTYGEKPAKVAVEKRLGRRLSNDMVTRHTRTQWVFCEPKAVPA